MPRSIRPPSNAVERRKITSDSQIVPGTEYQTLIDELEAVIVDRNIGSRVDVLRRVTDLFVAGSGHYSDEQRALFDDVMGRLVDEIESSARAKFGAQIATIADAPPKVSRTLALDDLIEVAGPLLAQSEQLDDETLIECAKNKSQEHLLAISRRKLLGESITDVLVERGNQQVVVSTAANSGAQFSQDGYLTLVKRSETDDQLALTIWSRPEIPHEHLLTLFATASDLVRSRLEAADRNKAASIRDMVKRASDELQTQVRARSPQFAAVQARVQQLHQTGALTEDRLREFAKAGSFDATAVALALLSDLPIGAIERTLVHEHSDQLLVLAKSVDLSWDTTEAILLMQTTTKIKHRSSYELEHCLSSFKKLKPETARIAIQFYRLRERANMATPI